MARKFEVDEVCAALGVGKAEYRGTGSFGETWRADFGGRDAAYKIIQNTGDNADRLSREVEGYRRIDNAHVVKLFDVRTFRVADVDRPVMIFEYIPGCDLSELIKVRRPSHEPPVPFPGRLAGVKMALGRLSDADVSLGCQPAHEPGAGARPGRVTHCCFEHAGQNFGSLDRGPRAAPVRCVDAMGGQVQ